ncbi:MAG: TetR/AcrR family transcriptional regulator, partial [Propionibacteriaceae bacterium]|nr:TetR/AcrR family transcriptional regulator [Propionibacteriaceae bacterium]
IVVARGLFAEKGLEGTSVEEIAAQAEVSKPVIYEHFNGKEGLYDVVVDRAVTALQEAISDSLSDTTSPRALIERGTLALLDFIEDHPDSFRIISRDSSPTAHGASFATILSDIASKVEDQLAGEFTKRNHDPRTAPLYAQMLVGLVALAGQWWVDNRDIHPLPKPLVASHLVNLTWYGMRGLKAAPRLHTLEEPA